MNILSDLRVPIIMGILNTTPDSFSDGGKFVDIETAFSHARTMIAQGATIIDVGGESTRPNSSSVCAEEQIRRVVPVIKAIRAFSSRIEISIDTTLSQVAAAALEAGATLINDISAGLQDEAILKLAADRNVSIILMHIQGNPQTMQNAPYYNDVVHEVLEHLKDRLALAVSLGVKKENIVLDVGIGFGKRRADNLKLLAQLEQFVALGYPILLGTSRKRFMGSLCAVDSPAELVTATAVTTALAVMQGVQIFRVHDVLENKQAIDVAWGIKSA